MSLLAAAILFVTPLILAPHLLFYYDITPKVAVIVAGAAIALALTAQNLDPLAALRGTRWGRWYLIAAGAWLAAIGLATIRSIHPELSWYGSNWRRMGAITYLALIPAAVWIAAYISRSAARLDRALRAICAGGVILSLYGIAQYFGWDPLLPAASYHVGEGVFEIVRPPGTLGHSDYFAAYLLWPVFAGIAVSSRFGWITAAAGSVAILLSGSRGALLALAAGLILLLFLRRPNLRATALLAAAAVAAIAIFFISPAGARLRARVHWATEDRLGGARLLLWRDSAAMAMTRPLAGFGPDTFVAEFPKFQSEELSRSYPDFLQESPHNMMLDALTEDGALGLIALLGIVAAGLGGGLARRMSPPAAALCCGLAASLIAQQFIVFTATTAFYFVLACGLLAGSGAQEVKAREVPLLWRRTALAGGIAAAVLLSFAAYRFVAADARLAKVQRRLDANNPAGAAEAYRQALTRPSAGVTADIYFSRRWAQVASQTSDVTSKLFYSQIAAGAASLATRSPEQRQNAWYNLCVILAPSNDIAAVESGLRSAIAASPTWYKPHWSLARLLILEGRHKDAAEEARRALYLNNGKDPEVSATLAEILGSGAPAQ